MQLFIKLQTPTIELKVTAKDASGAKDNFLVGFKRYELKETDAKLKALQEIMEEATKGDSLVQTELDKFIKNEIVYLKQIRLDLVDEKGNPKEYNIQDTRSVKPYETLWESPDECLAVLLEMYLASAPYRVSLIASLYKALLNNDYSEAEAKN